MLYCLDTPLLSTAYNTSLIYCFVIWCLHTNKRRPCSSTLSGHPSSSSIFIFRGARSIWWKSICPGATSSGVPDRSRCGTEYRSRNPLGTFCAPDRPRCARCELLYRSCNSLGALCASDRSRCGAVLILISQPSHHFGVGSLSLRHGAKSDMARTKYPLVTLCVSDRSLGGTHGADFSSFS